ncbi:gem-associated protein 8-like [Patiria miniata]|uniref:Gem-associated protein 8 n=1 Tax=Patiria miniata TaxID=46514 RepID=A0A914AIL5_PATMI|nr:gem-associated protein 8-like [Patiria miniata]
MDGNQVPDLSEASSMEITEGNYGDGSDEYTDEQNEQHAWYQQPQFGRFWQHYAAMQSWMQTYARMHQNGCSRYPATGYPLPMYCGSYPHFPPNPYHSQHFPQRTSMFHPHWNVNSQRAAHQYAGPSPYYHDSASQQRTHHRDKWGRDREYLNEEIEDSDDDDEDSEEIEISQEMLEFFRTSQKFREERDRAKAEAEKKSSGGKKKKNNPVRTEEKSDCRAPVERPDEGRRKGMKVLYGKHTARIHSMETAMQMQFDRNCDRLQPAFWPIVALKM